MRAALAFGLVLGAFAAAAQPVPDQPATPPACTAFAWPLLRELAWFSAPDLPRVASGGTLGQDRPGAVLELKPTAQVDFPVPPSRAPAEGSRAAVLHVPAPPAPGLYQVTLSDEAWIDVSQDGRTALPTVAHSGQRGCPALRKSVRYRVGAQPLTVEVSSARADTMRIAVAPVE